MLNISDVVHGVVKEMNVRVKERFVYIDVSLCLLHKVFGSTMGQDLILEFTKEMFTMKQFEQVSRHWSDKSSILLCCWFFCLPTTP